MLLLFLFLALSACLTQFATDIYLPSFASMAASFNVSLSVIQGTLSIYLLGVCASQVVYGPVSESVGRKKPLMFGIALMLIGSFLCAFSQSADVLYLARFVQGIGAGRVLLCGAIFFVISFQAKSWRSTVHTLLFLSFFVCLQRPLLGVF
ncbi:MAG: MFS transporter [Holosporaceae bacterium]|nr:MAG: MFS transporter [Holosporaceae bacterium]